MSIDDLSRDTADVAVRLLNGAPPGSIRRTVATAGSTDVRLARATAVGHPREPVAARQRRALSRSSLWRAYRRTVLSAVGVLAVQSLLIVGLLYQRRARRRAEIESRRNLALAADASRRQTMSALTSSIAHELGQPLSSIIHNAAGAADDGHRRIVRRPTRSGRSCPISRPRASSATQIIDRHRTMLRSHQLDKKPIDLHAVINDSLALVAHDMRARQIDGHRRICRRIRASSTAIRCSCSRCSSTW